MDTIGSIKDFKLKFKPSKPLLEYIKNIENKKLPTNVYLIKKKLIPDLSEEFKADDKYEISLNTTLQSKDVDFIKNQSDKLLDCDKNFNELYKNFQVDFGVNETESDEIEDVLHLEDLKWLAATIIAKNKRQNEKVFLHELLIGSTIILPENEIIKRNPDLEARCVKLRAQQEARQYQDMTRNVDTTRKHEPQETIAYQMNQINRHLIAILQFIFSVAAGFMFGFLGVELIIGNLDFGFRLLLGIMCSLIIALAEIYFLAKKLNEEDEYIKEIPKKAAAKVNKAQDRNPEETQTKPKNKKAKKND